MYNCVDCVIQIKGKANNITLDKCKKTGVVFGDVLATCELINCVSMQVQCTGGVPTVRILLSSLRLHPIVVPDSL